MTNYLKTRRHGLAAVEFAVVSPFFILIILGMIEIGRGINVKHVLLNSARAGCRVAITDGATEQDVATSVAANMVATGITAYNVTVTPNPLTTAAESDAVTVTVSVQYSSASWVPVPKYLGVETIVGSCTLPHE